MGVGYVAGAGPVGEGHGGGGAGGLVETMFRKRISGGRGSDIGCWKEESWTAVELKVACMCERDAEAGNANAYTYGR